MIQTDQRFTSVSSQTKGLQVDSDGSVHVSQLHSDAKGNYLDGGKTYKVTLLGPIPAKTATPTLTEGADQTNCFDPSPVTSAFRCHRNIELKISHRVFALRALGGQERGRSSFFWWPNVTFGA
jgi:hypothetical protein